MENNNTATHGRGSINETFTQAEKLLVKDKRVFWERDPDIFFPLLLNIRLFLWTNQILSCNYLAEREHFNVNTEVVQLFIYDKQRKSRSQLQNPRNKLQEHNYYNIFHVRR